MSKLALYLQGTSIPSSRAVDIPQELFEDIIWHASGIAEGIFFPTPSNHDLVKSLCSWSLVSKYFLTICRPRLFYFVRFANPKQLRRLLDIMEESPSSTLPPIATLIHVVIIHPEKHSTFWIHQAMTVLLPKFAPYHRERPVRVWMTLRTLDTQHSRAIGRLISRPVESLTLFGTSFAHLEDLMRFLGGFASIQVIQLNSIACDVIPSSPTLPVLPPFVGGRFHLHPTLLLYEPKDSAWTWLGTWLIGIAHGLPRSQLETSGLWDFLYTIHLYHGLSLYEGIGLTWFGQLPTQPHLETVHNIEFFRGKDKPASVETVTIAIVFRVMGGGIERRIQRLCFKLGGLWTNFPTASIEAEQNGNFWAHVISAAAKLRDIQEVHIVSDSMDVLKPFVRTFHRTPLDAECAGVRLVYGLVNDLVWSSRSEIPISWEDILPRRSAATSGAHRGNLWVATNWDACTNRPRLGRSLACAETNRMDVNILV